MKNYLLALLCLVLAGADAPTTAPAPSLKYMTWQIDGVTREAMVYIPPTPTDHPPLIFAFHGHGGHSSLAVRKFDFHELWPQAVCVYPQGLPTVSALVDPAGKQPGWEKAVGDENDRDLKFFDAMLATMKSDYHVDPKKVFVAGHSNGGFFAYVLWAARGDDIAAVAPISAFLNPKDSATFKPKPVFHVAGEADPLVKFDLQKRMIDYDRKVDGCDPDGKPDGEFCTEYSSKNGPPVIAFIHSGGHPIPDGAPKRIVEFFKGIAEPEPK